MCHQAVGLIQAEIEGRGIATPSITMMPQITGKVGFTRALEVPFSLGYPLGKPNAPMLQKAILTELLKLTYSADKPIIKSLALKKNKLLWQVGKTFRKEVA